MCIHIYKDSKFSVLRAEMLGLRAARINAILLYIGSKTNTQKNNLTFANKLVILTI